MPGFAIGPGAAVIFGLIFTYLALRELWGASIRIKAITTFVVVAILAVSIVGSAVFFNYRNQVREDIRQLLLNMVSIAALQQNAELHATILNPGDEESEAYKQIKAVNAAILKTNPNLVYLYTMRQDNQGRIIYVVDTGQPGAETAAVAEEYVDASPLLKEKFATLNQPIVESDFYTDRFGTFLSAYAPFYDKNGRREGVIGLDINANQVLSAEQNVFNIILVTSIIAISAVTLLGLWLGNLFVEPIVNLSRATQKVIEGDLNARVEQQTTDEVGALAKAFNTMTAQLQSTLQGLEQRIQDRTSELAQQTELLTQQTEALQTANRYNERRATQFKAISEVSRATASIQRLDELLPRIVEVISQQFGYYHAGIFLADEANEYAVLVAANSEGGQRMLRRGHRLKIGEVGIVGNVVASGAPRIALDTGADAVYFKNPDLPDTRSEMALPLRAGNTIIGALDVQSKEPGAFGQDDIEVLSTLADQVSIAIQNARQFEATQKALSEAEAIYRQYLRTEWTRLTQRQTVTGFTYSLLGTRQIPADYTTEETRQALERGEPQILSTENVSALAVPIKLRDEVIGVLNVRAPAGHDWLENEIDLVRAVAERVAISAENARLFEETTSRAERERIVADITNKIRSTNDPDEMLQTALAELKRALNVSKVQIVPFRPEARTNQ
ncbi:MAG: GAF domain-containing protein [Anaerolineales bacterium]